MATPTSPERRLLAAGAKKATTWGTAAALGVGSELLLTKLSGMDHSQDYVPAKYANRAFPTANGVLTNIKPPEVTIEAELQYDHGTLEMLMALLFGTAGAPAAQGATVAYKHIYQWADLVAGFATLCRENAGIIYEVPSFMPSEFTIKVSNGLIIAELKGRGNLVKDDSSVNAATQIDALTFVGQDTPMLFSHGVFKINAESGADVASETALEVAGFEISFKRNHDAQHVAGSSSIIRPRESDFPEVRVKLDFPRFDAVNKLHLAALKAETTQKMLIAFTSPLLAATAYPYSRKFYFPRLRMVDTKAPWEEIVKNGLELVAEQATANPTGMSYARPYLETINKFATDVLA